MNAYKPTQQFRSVAKRLFCLSTLCLSFWSISILHAQADKFPGTWELKWDNPSGGQNQLLLTIPLPQNGRYEVSLWMSVNKYTWKWSATKANGQLVGQTAVEGQKPLLSILPDGKLKMTKFRMMGSEETTFTLVQAFEAPAYSDLNTFWRDFKAAALAKNYAKIQTLTKYPFYNHMGLESAEQFKEFEFPDYLLKALATAQAPKKSTMVFENYKQGSLWEVDYGGPALYFTQHNGEWRFAGVLYGE